MLLVKKFKVTEMEMIVNLKEHSYPIYIEKNILKHANEKIKEVFKGKKIMIISDDQVYPLYGDDLTLNLEKDFTDRSLVWQWFQENIPSAWKSTKQKDLELLKQAFITWVLRQESWAAITDSEFDRYDTQFFPKQWDTTKTIEKKQQLREQAIRNMYQMAGNDTNWTPIVQIYDKTKQYSTPKEYNASTSYKSGDRFIKDWKTREVWTDGRAYEK